MIITLCRLVLSACSDFFRTVLRGMGSGRISPSGQNSVLYLRGVTYTDLEAVLNFMYHGEANVAQVFVASRISNRVLEHKFPP